MAKIMLKTDLATSAADIWEAIGDFDAWSSWHPLAEALDVQGEGSGALRRLRFKGLSGVVVERLEARNDRERVYSYSVVESPLPVSEYRAELKVLDNGDGTSSVEWSGFFEPKGTTEFDAVRQIQTLMQSGLDNLSRLYGIKK